MSTRNIKEYQEKSAVIRLRREQDEAHAVSFGEYLAAIYKKPKKDTEQKLLNLLSGILWLAEGINDLQPAGTPCPALSPERILVRYNAQYEIEPESISLLSPEESGEASPQSVLRSIGEVLFHALCYPEIYDHTDYDRIDVYVSASRMIALSEITSDVRFCAALAQILCKTLAADPKERYEELGELIRNLNSVCSYLMLMMENARQEELERQKEKPEKERIVNSTAVIQNLLYKHPLYNYLPENAQELEVLVVGADTYGQKFMDLCLQAGQMKGVRLSVTAVSDDADRDRELYLKPRPELSRFFNIGNSVQDRALSYGTVRFHQLGGETHQFQKSDRKGNREKIRAVLEREVIKKHGGVRYVLVALQDDELSHEIAKLFTDILREQGNNAFVGFIWRGAHRKFRKGNPVYVNDDISLSAIDPELERMAFNVHKIWNGAAGADSFREKYYYISSIAFALSVPYKLKSAGIDAAEMGIRAAAEAFQERILDRRDSDPSVNALFDQLVALEHRRWVTEKITNGWSAPMDASGKMDYTSALKRCCIKDEAKKLHPCIVRSRAGAPLSGEEYQKEHFAKWERPVDKTLDELDRVSVEQHQFFQEQARQYRVSNPLQNGDAQRIRHILPRNHEDAIRTFNEYCFCLKHILNGSRSYSQKYRHFEKAFLRTLKDMPEDVQKEIGSRLEHIRRAFFPLVESSLYRNYKKNDEDLIAQIPYVLTNHSDPYMMMAFEDGKQFNGRNEAVFCNVASATVLRPKKICYLYYFGADSDAEFLTGEIWSALNYFKVRNMDVQCDFVIAVPEVRRRDGEHLGRLLERLQQEDDLGRLKLVECIGEEDAAEALLNAVKRRRVDLFDGTTSLFSAHLQNARFLRQVTGQYPYFEFDWKKKQFTHCVNCGELRYIRDESAIRIEEMFALGNASDNRFHLPEFAEDYEIFWDIYTGKAYGETRHGVTSWNKLSGKLQKYAEENDRIAALTSDGKNREKRHLTYFFPSGCYDSVSYILEKLKEYGAVLEESALYGYTTDTSRAEIWTMWNIGTVLENLFSNPYLSAEPRCFEVASYYIKDEKRVVISFDHLEVQEVRLDNRNQVLILDELYRRHFITRLRKKAIQEKRVNANGDERLEDRWDVSFCYSSHRIKQLLTTAGEILEIYTYYEAVKTGFFDDVACGYEFHWEADDVVNELDCVLTKGFQSILVECKARTKVEQDFYHKLMSISEQFGIGAKRVLIANTYLHNNENDTQNEMQRIRGNMMNIITVSDPEDIQNIGQTLVKIMKGTYKGTGGR